MNKKVLTISIILVLAVVILGVVFGMQKKEVKEPAVENDQLTETATTTEVIEISEIDTSNWKTYRNEEYGFEMKYPRDWIVKNNSGLNKLTERIVKNITFSSPNNNILIFGIKRDSESGVDIMARSGFPATDEFKKSSKTINIAGTKIEIIELIFLGKVKEKYYSKLNSAHEPYTYFQIGDFIAHATLMHDNNDYVDYKNIDLENTKDFNIADSILESLSF